MAVRVSASFFLRDVGDEALGGEQQAADGGGVLQGGAGHLGRIDHTGLAERG